MGTYIVSGATSFLGYPLVKKLLKNGNNVYCLIRNQSLESEKAIQLKRLGAIIIESELGQYNKIQYAFSNIDFFIHLAWAGAGASGRRDEDTQKMNFIYSKDALEFAKSISVKYFIFGGSQAEYGKIDSKEKEDAVCNPISTYGKTKKKFADFAKEYCNAENIKFIHLRIFSVYGQGDHEKSLVNYCLHSFLSNESVTLGPCTQLWNYLYIEDFVELVTNLFDNAEYIDQNIINIASDDTRQLRSYVRTMHESCLSLGQYHFSETNPNPEGCVDLNPDISYLMKILGPFRFTSFKDGIKKILDWKKENEN